MKKNRKYIFGLLISAFCIWWVFRSLDLEEVKTVILTIDKSWAFLAIVCTILSYIVRAFRWKFFFKKSAPSLWDSYCCLITGFFMNNVLPARMGEFVRAHLGGRVTKQSRSIVLATIAGERLADGFIISLFFVLAMSFSKLAVDSDKVSGLYTVSWLFFIAVLGTVFVLIFRKKVFQLLEYLVQVMPGHLSKYSLNKIQKFFEGLEPLIEPKRAFVLFSLSVLVWAIELLAYEQVAKAFGQTLALAPLVLFLAVVNFSSLIPAAPGGVGVIEAVATVVLVKIGIPNATAFAMVASQHLIQYLVVGIPGLFFFFKLRKKIQQSIEQEEQQEQEAFVDVSEDLADEQEPKLIRDKTDLIDFSMVIPAYNEEARVLETLVSAHSLLKKNYRNFEIIVVNDGSIDQTTAIVLQAAKKLPEIKLLELKKNKGKGYAVRCGILNSLGRLVLYADADGASPIEEGDRLLKAINAGADVAIGSRARFAADTKVDTVMHRKVMGRVFNGLVNLLLLPGVADTQCGFKLFKRDSALSIFKNLTADRFSFDVELIFLARKLGYKIVEVPINWTNIPGSKVNLFTDSAAMLRDVILFRLKDVFGGYRGLAK